MITDWYIFNRPSQLAEVFAARVGEILRGAVDEKGKAILAVSGGTTPKLFFEALSAVELEWKKITVTLVDERQVPEDSPRSNAKLVMETLLQNKASFAKFVPLYQNFTAADIGTFDVAILGMGNDGHTASFFPGGDNLAAALDPDGKTAILEMNAPAAGEPRLTFSLPKILAASHLFLHIQGQDKRDVLNQAVGGTDQFQMPVRAVLNATKPVKIYWCP